MKIPPALLITPIAALPPSESTGEATRKSVLGGRYYVSKVEGETEMPGADGKMHKMDFKGESTDGYDNAKGKFINTWIDNMGTGIMMAEGDYDAATKTFTYVSEYEMQPGVKTPVRETIKITDADHHLFEYFEKRGDDYVKTMEINYTRAK